ncbi:MAG: DUF4281 domain-containing protein [Synechococcaceae cyanobacterium SM2_3_1]|nr:DUF4281 domain-containing protein [Synechococcaceae cyanobacterium SM2_3_1]
MNTAQLFDAANLFVLPFWGLMILFPRWGVTRRLLQPFWPYAGLACVYIYLLLTSLTPEAAAAMSNPRLADIARFFADEQAAATGWVHFLVMDLFVGRWIYLEGQRTGLWTSHSLLLCLFAGPVGLLSHLLTDGMVTAVRRRSVSDPESQLASAASDVES